MTNEAKRNAGKIPQTIITARIAAYIDGIELVIGADTKHVQGRPFVDKDSTNMKEGFHGTMKDRTNVILGFKNIDNANSLTDAWLVHHNLFKELESLGNIPPAQKIGRVRFKDWEDVLQAAKADVVKPQFTLESISSPAPRITKRMPRLTMKQPHISQNHKPIMPMVKWLS